MEEPIWNGETDLNAGSSIISADSLCSAQLAEKVRVIDRIKPIMALCRLPLNAISHITNFISIR
jgi:hypothetical protein